MTSSARPAAPAASLPRTIARVLLGLVLLGAGIIHLMVARQEFTAQVPEWLPVPDDAVVLGSGVAEIVLGAALVVLPRRRVLLGWLAAAFFVAVFPGLLRVPGLGRALEELAFFTTDVKILGVYPADSFRSG